MLFIAFNGMSQTYLLSRAYSSQSYSPTYSSYSYNTNIKVKSVKYYSANRMYTYTYRPPSYMTHRNTYYYPKKLTYNLLIIKP